MKQMIVLLVLCFALRSSAQYQGIVYAKNPNPTILNENGDLLTDPFLGGLNSFYVQGIELNNDGRQDLLIYDHIQQIVVPFRNIGTSTQPKYKYAPEFKDSFPPTYNYMLVRDYNCDNVPDLFTYGSFGIRAFKGKYINNRISFSFYKVLEHPGVIGKVGLYSGSIDLPDVVDVDGDEDLDIVAMHSAGTFLQLYKNLRAENKEPCDSLTYTFVNGCYAGAVQGFVREWQLNSMCKPAVSDEGNIELEKKVRHGSNNLTVIDIEGDGDQDLLAGNSNYSDIQLLKRSGSGNYTSQDTMWKGSTGSSPIFIPFYPNFSHFDFDGDNKKDLIIMPHQEQNTAQQFSNSNKCLFYKNTGTATTPVYTFASDDIIFKDMIDVGMNSYPTFFDVNKDGLLDLLISGSTPDDSTYKLRGQIYYYQNTSTPNNIQFKLENKNYLDLYQKNYNSLYPCFGDVNNDGVLDLLMGTDKGRIIYYKNIATSNTALPDFIWQTDSFMNISTQDYAAPCLVDLDEDGDQDLIIGRRNGSLDYYKNENSIFTFVKSDLGNFKVGGINQFGYAAPKLVILDSFNRKQLLIGTGDGTLERYDSLFNNINGNFTRLDSFYSTIQTYPRAVPALADIDKDGNYDLVVGNKMGGINIFKQILHTGNPDTTLGTVSITELPINGLQIFPNPTSGKIYIDLNEPVSEQLKLQLFNSMGQILYQQDLNYGTRYEIDLSSIPSGIIQYKIFSDKHLNRGKFIKE